MRLHHFTEVQADQDTLLCFLLLSRPLWAVGAMPGLLKAICVTELKGNCVDLYEELHIRP